MLTNERLAEIRELFQRPDEGQLNNIGQLNAYCFRGERAVVIIPALLAEIDRLRARDRKYNLVLLEQLQKVYSEGTVPDTLYFSDGLQTSVAIIQELEEADLFERVGEGPGGHVMGRLTDKGRQMMEGMK